MWSWPRPFQTILCGYVGTLSGNSLTHSWCVDSWGPLRRLSAMSTFLCTLPHLFPAGCRSVANLLYPCLSRATRKSSPVHTCSLGTRRSNLKSVVLTISELLALNAEKLMCHVTLPMPPFWKILRGYVRTVLENIIKQCQAMTALLLLLLLLHLTSAIEKQLFKSASSLHWM